MSNKTEQYNPHQLGYYRNLFLSQYVVSVCNEEYDNRQACFCCQRKRLTGYLTTKGFLCSNCLESIQKTAKKQNCELNITDFSGRNMTSLSLSEDESEELEDYLDEFKSALVIYLETTNIPAIKLGDKIVSLLQEKQIYAPKTFSLPNAMSLLKREIFLPKEKHIVELWREWIKQYIPDFEFIFDTFRQENNWKDKSIFLFVQHCCDTEEVAYLASYWSQLTEEKQTTAQLQLQLW